MMNWFDERLQQKYDHDITPVGIRKHFNTDGSERIEGCCVDESIKKSMTESINTIRESNFY